MSQVITQTVVEAAKVVIMAVREADNLVNNSRSVHRAPRSGSPALKQPNLTAKWQANISNCATLKRE